MKPSSRFLAVALLAIGVLSVSSADAIMEVWVADGTSTNISVIDSETPGLAGSPFSLGLTSYVPSMAQVADEVWISSNFNGTVKRFDLQGQYLTEFSVSTTTPALAMTQVGTDVWISKMGGGTALLRKTLTGGNRPGVTLNPAMPNRTAALTYADGKVWASDTMVPVLRAFNTFGSAYGLPDVYLQFAGGGTIASLTTVTHYEFPDPGYPPVETYEIWAGNSFGDEIIRLDTMGAVLGSFNCGMYTTQALAFVSDYVWEPPADGLADFDRDGDVDLEDFVILKKNFARGTEHSEGDANFDGTVNLDDFVILKQQFATGASVPEPTALALLFASAGWLVRRKRR